MRNANAHERRGMERGKEKVANVIEIRFSASSVELWKSRVHVKSAALYHILSIPFAATGAMGGTDRRANQQTASFVC